MSLGWPELFAFTNPPEKSTYFSWGKLTGASLSRGIIVFVKIGRKTI
jgi:hypothetical protein